MARVTVARQADPEKAEIAEVNRQRDALRQDCRKLMDDLDVLAARGLFPRARRIVQSIHALEGKLPSVPETRPWRGGTVTIPGQVKDMIERWAILRTAAQLRSTRAQLIDLLAALATPWASPPTEPELWPVPLAKWEPGDDAKRSERWKGWALMPSGDATLFVTTVGEITVRARSDAGGYYAEAVHGPSERLLRFVYPRPMLKGQSMSRDYDWDRSARDRQLAVDTASLAVDQLRTDPRVRRRLLESVR